jgi:hypothetical protein
LLCFLLFCGFTPTARTAGDPLPSTDHPSAPDLNYLGWGKDSPTPIRGGVNVVVEHKASAGFTCTQIVIRVIDEATGETLDTLTVKSPGKTVTAAFNGLGNNRKVQVTVEATFRSGGTFESALIEAVLATQ